MKIVKQMPTTIILIFFSLLFAIGGVALGFYFMIINQAENRVIIGLCIMLISIFLAVLVRSIANMGQIFFDMKAENFNLLNEIKNCLYVQNQILDKDFQALTQATNNASRENKDLSQKISQNFSNQLTHGMGTLNDALEKINCESKDINQGIHQIGSFIEQNEALEKISCDSKDMNQGIHQIRSFFEKIERHLDLNK